MSEVQSPPATEEQVTFQLQKIPISKIRLYPDQPRTEFDEEELLGLSGSIKEIGQQTPVSVRSIEDDRYEYELIDGERRYRACLLANKKNIWAYVYPVKSESEQFIRAVAANFCRSGHTPLETAFALEKMINNILEEEAEEIPTRNLAIEKAARICGRSTAWVAQHLGLLKLCEEVREQIKSKLIPFQVGVALTNLKPEHQISFAKHIVKCDLNFKQALHYIRVNTDRDKLTADGRARRPSGDYERFRRFLNYLTIETENLLDTPFKKILAMFENRPSQDLSEAIRLLDNTSEEFHLLADNLRNVQRGGQKS